MHTLSLPVPSLGAPFKLQGLECPFTGASRPRNDNKNALFAGA